MAAVTRAFGADTTDALSASETLCHYKADFLSGVAVHFCSGELEILLLPGSTAFGYMMHAVQKQNERPCHAIFLESKQFYRVF